MTCPKCRATIGIVPETIATHHGMTRGVLCYMCGHWIQDFPRTKPAYEQDHALPCPA
jgi:hypothetical protein